MLRIIAAKKCKYCNRLATREVVWADYRAYIPICNATKCKKIAEDKIIIDNQDEVAEVREIS